MAPKVQEGQLYKTIRYDVNSDGVDEIVALSAYKVEGDEYLGQLIVTDLDGQHLFEGPRPEKSSDAFAFGHFHYGDADIQAIIADEDDSGSHISLIGATPVSDLRPTPFRVWRWNDGMFIPEFVNTLIERPAESNCYVWEAKDFEYADDRWISKFYYNKDGELMATVIDTTCEERVLLGEAKVVITENGIGLKDWVQLPK
ncbi:MAG: hypothetical protein Q4F00_13275 [bacterium]|nr:hypothetical protein [bacterium]